MSRPQGQPGTFVFGHETVTAMRDRDGLYHWQAPRSGKWFQATRLARLIARRFIEDDVPEWVPLCSHPTICETEAACVALEREDEGKWGR